MSEYRLDPCLLRRRFARAAASYERHDALQQAVQAALFERLNIYKKQPATIVDLGAGTGRGAAQLKARYPKARVIAIDLALPMLQQVRRYARWRRPLELVAGDMRQLPLAERSVDLLHANLSFQWIDEPGPLFTECARVLRPGGLLLFSSFGPDTLAELRAAWANVDQDPHVHRFLDIHDVGDAMLAAGLSDPVLEVDRYCLTYAQPLDLLHELRGLGATHAAQQRSRSLTGKQRFQRMLAAYEDQRKDDRIPAGWEVILAHAWGPAPGQPRRETRGSEIASIPLQNLRGSRLRHS